MGNEDYVGFIWIRKSTSAGVYEREEKEETLLFSGICRHLIWPKSKTPDYTG
jgi:hypothetical protein